MGEVRALLQHKSSENQADEIETTPPQIDPPLDPADADIASSTPAELVLDLRVSSSTHQHSHGVDTSTTSVLEVAIPDLLIPPMVDQRASSTHL